jgi:flagellar biosynthesis protein FlhB
MSEQPDRDQQTEAATPKRKQDAEKEGDILQSRELATALVMLAGAAWLMLAGPWFIRQCLALLRDGLTLSGYELRNFDPAAQTLRLADMALLPLASLMGLALLACVAGQAAMGSFGFRGNAMAFKASRINPIAGLGRMFGTHGLIELVKALAKATLLGALGWWLLSSELPMTMGLVKQDIHAATGSMGWSVAMSVMILGLGLGAIAGIDVPIQIIRRNIRLRMTKQQVKDELRQTEGAPELKAHLRQRQHEVLMGSARKAVSEATVVLTNPTHFSVALRYRPGKDAVPLVVARGRGETALAIRELAKEKSVPTLEYPQLTRAIYFTTRAGQAIAEDLYLAVAAILAFVFNIERALAEGVSQPNVDVPETKRFDEHGKLKL